MPTRFNTPNVPNRAMSKPIPDDIWENNRPFIEEERKKGTSIDKIAHILRGRRDAKFAPSASQIRHRVKHKWRATERRNIPTIPEQISNSSRNTSFDLQNDRPIQAIHRMDNFTDLEFDVNPFRTPSPNTSWRLQISHMSPIFSSYDPWWRARSPNLDSINRQQLSVPSSSTQQLAAGLEMLQHSSNYSSDFPSYTQSDSPTIGNFGLTKETDLLRIILFILENDLLNTASDDLRQTLLNQTRSIHPETVADALRLSLNHSLDDETSEKSFLFVVEARNHGLTQVFMERKIKLTSKSVVKVYNMALENENLDLVRYMLSAYVDLSTLDPFSSSIEYELRYGRKRIVESSLEFACLRGNYELVDLLLCAGASPTRVPGYTDEESGEVFPPRGINPITTALSTINDDRRLLQNQSESISMVKKIIERLLEKGADVNSSYGCTNCLECPSAVPIIEAAGQLQLDIVQFLLGKEAQVHKNSMGRSVLLCVAESQWFPQSTAIARVLIKAGVDVNQKIAVKEINVSDDARTWAEIKLGMCRQDYPTFDEDRNNVSAFELAVEAGNKEFINILLDAKARDELPIPYQLLTAIRDQDTRSANLLLETGVVPQNPLDAVQEALRSSMSEFAYFLIELAQERGESWPGVSGSRPLEVGTIQFLLNAECTPGVRGLKSALGVAADHGDTALVQQLLTINDESGRKSVPEDSRGLSKAVHGGHEAIVKLLLDYGVTPFHEEINAALKIQNKSILRLLCGYQTNNFAIQPENFPFFLDLDLYQDPVAALVLEYDKSTCSACRRIPRFRSYKTFEWVLSFPAWMIKTGNLKLISMVKELHVRMEEEWVTEAVRFKQFGMLVALLDQFQAQAGPLSPNFGGEALAEAVRIDSITTAERLLTFGVNPGCSAPSRYCTSALGTALRMDPSGLGRSMLSTLLKKVPDKNLIVDRGPTISYTALLAAIEVGNLSYTTMLIEDGADVNLPPTKQTQRTPLQAACATANKMMVKLLLNRGANIDTPAFRYKGATALQFAAMSGHVEILLDLLDGGADVNAPAARFDGRTAVQGAAEHGRVSALKLLLDHGAKIDSRQYNRALELAAKNGHRKVISILEEVKERIPGYLL